MTSPAARASYRFCIRSINKEKPTASCSRRRFSAARPTRLKQSRREVFGDAAEDFAHGGVQMWHLGRAGPAPGIANRCGKGFSMADLTAALPLPAELSRDMLLTLYRNMLLQRAVDARGYQLNRQGKIAIAMSSEGHEAVQAGTGLAFERGRDLLYPYYRDTGLLLACGFPLADLFRSQFARRSDRTGGRSIINHVTSKSGGIASISSTIAAHLPHAVGAAWALRARGESDRAVFALFGEGATSAGEWHESMNFAAVHRLPVIFVCENNQWAISTPIVKQMVVPDVYKKAAGYGMRGLVCDGFDPVAVYRAVHEARAHVVSGAGPCLVEAKCYRFLSHTTDDDDRTYRTRAEIARHRVNDPVPNFEARLRAAQIIDAAAAEAMRDAVTQLVNATTDAVEAEAGPAAHELYADVYAGPGDAWV
jgi:2-oxoisovalerate dehydrogenase E1 component alpha subunit